MKTPAVVLIIIIFSTLSSAQPVWNYQYSGTTNNLNRIIRKNSTNGPQLFVVGDNGIILRSSNSGLIWEIINSNTNSNLYSIGISSSTGYTVGSNGTIIRTTDEGKNWSAMISNTTNSLKEIRILNGNIMAIAVGENGTFLKLENDIWTASQIDTADLNSITYDAFNQNILVAVGNYGVILRSTNSGVNWSRINSNTSNDLNYISGEIVIGDNGIALRVNGTTIFEIHTGTINDLNNFSEYNNSVLVCGANGTILKYFQPMITNLSQKLNSILQTGVDNCFLTGDNGSILFTNTFNVTPNANQLNSNNISAWFFNNGIFNHNPAGISGFEWPKGGGIY